MHANTRFKINSPPIICETMDDETVLIDLETGVYYSLENAGAAVWTGLQDRQTPARITEGLCRRYDAPNEVISKTVTDLVETLLEEKLITPCDSPDDPLLPSPQRSPSHDRAGAVDARARFEKCELVKYTDMQELLLLDPIHEADATGWPKPDPTR